MSYKYQTLLLTAILPFALVGCGGGSSGGSNPPSPPPPPPNPTKIIKITAAGQDLQNLQMSGPVLSAAIKGSLKNRQAPYGLFKDEDNVNPVVTLTIEYTAGDSAPDLLGSSDGVFTFDGFDYDEQCSNPVNQGDLCMHANLFFMPNSTSYDKSASLLNGMVKAHGYVPFRMFPQNNSIVIGTPTSPDVHMVMTTKDPNTGGVYNMLGMPAQANFSSAEMLDSNQQKLNIPFKLSADKTSGLIDVDYKCTTGSLPDVCGSDFVKAAYLKNYSKDTQLGYTAIAPDNMPAETETDIPVSAILTRSFVVTTDQGEAYALNNPTQDTLSILGTLKKNAQGQSEFASLDSYTNFNSLKDIELPVRYSAQNDFISHVTPIKDGKDSLDTAVLTGASYDKEVSPLNDGEDVGSENYLDRVRFYYDDGISYVVSLVKNTDSKDPNYYHFIETDDSSSQPYVATIKGLPALDHVKMAVDYSSSVVHTGVATLIFAGFNSKTAKQEVYYTNFYHHPTSTLKAVEFEATQINIDPSLISNPIVFNYNLYTTESNPGMMAPQQKLIYFNKDDTQMTTVGFDSINQEPIITTVDLSNVVGTPKTFICSDANASSSSLSNTCYLMTENLADKTTPYHLYMFKNLDLTKSTTIKTDSSNLSALSFTKDITQPLNKAVIDGNTGSLLTMDTNDNVQLYTLNGNTYQAAQDVALPSSPQSKAQKATNIYVY